MAYVRRRVAVAIAAAICGLFGVVSGGIAGDFPSRTLNFVVPFGAGGASDVMTRVIAQKLAENVGRPAVVENRPGGGGQIAAQYVMSAPADGHTIWVVDTSHVVINPSLYSKLQYDPTKDFAAVMRVANTSLFMAVGASVPVHSVKELIDHARANPGLMYGSSGNGSVHHLGMELFKSLTGVNMTHVPYKGLSQSLPALVGGEISVLLGALPALAPHVKTGKVRLLAVVGAGKREPSMPDVPTIAEVGVGGYEIDVDVGMLVRADTRPDVVASLNAEIARALRAPEVVDRLAGYGFEVVSSSPEAFAEWIRARIPKYGKLVRDSGARVD